MQSYHVDCPRHVTTKNVTKQSKSLHSQYTRLYLERMNSTTTTRPCGKCSATGTFLHFGMCFDCNGTGRVKEQPMPKQTRCTCGDASVWCFMSGHSFDKAFPKARRERRAGRFESAHSAACSKWAR